MAEEKQVRILHTKTGAIKFVPEHLAKNKQLLKRNGFVIHEIQNEVIESSGHATENDLIPEIPTIKKRK